MKTYYLKIQSTFCLLLFISQVIFAQTDCVTKLKTAESNFDNGKIREVEPLLRGCIEDGFTKDEKIRAYKLIAQSCIYLEQQKEADTLILKILQLDPDQKINPSIDPREYIVKFETFRTLPVFHWGIILGGNRSIVSLVETFSSENVPTSNKYYQYPFGFQIGFLGEKLIKSNWQASMEAHYSSRTFKVHDDTLNNSASLVLQETQNWLTIPVSIRYEFFTREQKVRPYIGTGPMLNLLLSATQTNGVLSNFETGDTKLPSINVKDYRNSFYLSLGLIGGLKYKLSTKLFAILDIKYNWVFSKSIDQETFNADILGRSSNLWSLQYIDDQIKLNNLAVSLGVKYAIYRPKKVKQGF